MRLLVVALAGIALAGCGSPGAPSAERSPAPAATAPPTYPVAYRMPRDEISRLAASGDALAALEREQVFGVSAYEAYPVVVVMEWLRERGIDLRLPRPLRPALQRVFDEQALTVIVVGREHRRHRERLASLEPSERELRRYYEVFNEHDWPESGKAMLEWLGIVKRAVAAVDARTLIVIPVTE